MRDRTSLTCSLLTLVVWLSATSAATGPGALEPGQQIRAAIVRYLAMPENDPMHMPTDVAVDGAGRVFIADGANDRVVCLDFATGLFRRQVTLFDQTPLKRPVGLAVDSDDRLWVADSGNHRVVLFDRDGNSREMIDLPAEGQRLSEPTDLAITPDRLRACIVDNRNHRLLIRDNATGHFIVQGQFGRSLGQFRWPFMAAIAGNGDIYVTDVIGARVQRLSPQMRWAGHVGRWGLEAGELYRPKGIAIGPGDNVFVSDSTLGVVQVFDALGELVGVLSDASGSPLRFKHPMGLCLNDRNHLLVVELRANRVAVVEMAGFFSGLDSILSNAAGGDNGR